MPKYSEKYVQDLQITNRTLNQNIQFLEEMNALLTRQLPNNSQRSAGKNSLLSDIEERLRGLDAMPITAIKALCAEFTDTSAKLNLFLKPSIDRLNKFHSTYPNELSAKDLVEVKISLTSLYHLFYLILQYITYEERKND